MPASPYVTEYEGTRVTPVGFEAVEQGQVAEVVAALTRTDRQPWRSDFRTGALDPSEWQSPVVGAGMTVDPSTGNLVISTGTTASSSSYVRSVRQFSSPVRVQVAATISQRIANQEFYIELVDSSGNVFAHWKFTGTSATAGTAEVSTSALASNQTLGTAATTASTATSQLFEIDLGMDEAIFRTRALNSNGAATDRATFQGNLPHPDDKLYLQVRAVNLGTAPASTTSFTINHVLVQDVNELAVEIAGGRGTTGTNSAISVAPQALIASSARIGSVGAQSIWQNPTNAALAASATFTGTARDLFGGAVNVSSGTAAYAKEYRALAVADQAGTLHLEVSPDNVTFRRIQSVATTLQGGSQVATIQHAPVMRYARVVYVNGATLQGFFSLAEAYFSS